MYTKATWTANHTHYKPTTAGGQAGLPVQVNGLLHGAVTMSIPWNKTRPVNFASWKYSKNGTPKAILDTSKPPYNIYNSQFSGRLEVTDSLMTVTIKDLREEDSGMFSSEITTEDGTVDTFSYNITIYEPVPILDIRAEGKSVTSDWCNVTFYCSVPSNTSALSYNWRYRHNNSEHYLYNNGATTQVSLRPEYWDMELLCVVHNPADQKNVSLHIQKECNLLAMEGHRNHHVIVIIVSCISIVLVIMVIMKICIPRMKRRKEFQNPTENRIGETLYIEVTSTREDLDHQIPPALYDTVSAPKTTKAQTIYTSLQHPRPK
ncbi:SLAM family member 5-like isoform X2 [Pseudophryne corroboree]|uniref:SLAM family member 5-like isoform X2 n=1 Tax=Pseudophryne corroboree TaxID=495146 RepID=UPI00308215D4